MNKKSKKILIAIISLAVISIILIVCIFIMKSNTENEEEAYAYTGESEDIEEVKGLHYLNDVNSYYEVSACVDKFYSYYSDIFSDAESNYYMTGKVGQVNTEAVQKASAEEVYNMLDPEYIEYKGITNANITEKLDKLENIEVNITDIYVSEKGSNVNVYIVKGVLRDEKTENITNLNVMLKLDLINETFTVYLHDYLKEKYKDLKLGEEIDASVPESIEKNGSNQYSHKVIDEETYVRDLFSKYRTDILYYPEIAYNSLDEEYRKARFGTLEDFKAYAKETVRQSLLMQAEKYNKTQTDDYTQYTCIDGNGNYYIFRETSTMKYTLLLDTYTIDIPEFLEKYNNATEDQKVGYNIQKVFEAINNKDYKYVYNKLDETFKQNNFKTQADFETYMEQNFYERNNVTYENYEQSGDLYIYNITISDANNEERGTISKNIIMQLKEGTDFVMSFNKN